MRASDVEICDAEDISAKVLKRRGCPGPRQHISSGWNHDCAYRNISLNMVLGVHLISRVWVLRKG